MQATLPARDGVDLHRLHRLSGAALVVITLIIPLGVFMRYAMNSPLSWPEPAAVMMMVMFSFLGGAAVYRANVHIAVEALLDAVRPGAAPRHAVGGRPAAWRLTAAFMLGYGVQLCLVTWYQTMAEFPGLSRASSTCRSRSPAC